MPKYSDATSGKAKGEPLSRSEVMARVRSKGSRPEMLVRRTVHGLGYRFRLHARDLPGSPDLVFRPRRKVIFVHGCFWHGHSCTAGQRQPKSRKEFWLPKLARNAERDAEALEALAEGGWDAMVVWECELADTAALSSRVLEFLGPAKTGGGGMEVRGGLRSNDN